MAHLDALDAALTDTYTFLESVRQGLPAQSEPTTRDAYHAARAVLQTLRERLTVDLAAALGAQLPVVVRGLYYEGFRPADQPADYRDLAGWSAHVYDRILLPNADFSAQDATKAVFDALTDQVDRGVAEKVFNALPHDVRDLWRALDEDVAHQEH
jgi:uncharacterized protein (DUF2267 family)